MKSLLTVLLFVFSISAIADFTRKAPTEREDSTPLNQNEISGYRIYFGVKSGTYTDSITVNDGSATSYKYTSPTDKYAVMTTVDTDGRESKYSAEVLVKGSGQVVVKAPATLTDLKVEYIASIDRYLISWTLPTTLADGVTPIGEIVRLYLFDNGKWVRDINSPTDSIYVDLAKGDHLIDMEVELKYPDGARVVSVRSEMVAVVVKSNPMPPNELKATVNNRLVINLNDDFSSLIAHRFMAQGSRRSFT